MNARDQGHQAVRSLTSMLALSGVALVGGLGIATYTDIRSAKAAPTQTSSSDGSTASTTPATPSKQAPTDSGSATSTSQSSSPAGVSAGSGPSQTSSSGS